MCFIERLSHEMHQSIFVPEGVGLNMSIVRHDVCGQAWSGMKFSQNNNSCCGKAATFLASLDMLKSLLSLYSCKNRVGVCSWTDASVLVDRCECTRREDLARAKHCSDFHVENQSLLQERGRPISALLLWLKYDVHTACDFGRRDFCETVHPVLFALSDHSMCATSTVGPAQALTMWSTKSKRLKSYQAVVTRLTT